MQSSLNLEKPQSDDDASPLANFLFALKASET
jgi:hypothetical protein